MVTCQTNFNRLGQISTRSHQNIQELQARLPEVLLSTTDLPKLLNQSLQSLATLGAHQDALLHEIQSLRADGLNERRHDWIALAGFILMLGMAWWSALAIHLYLAPIFFILAIGVILWRVLL